MKIELTSTLKPLLQTLPKAPSFLKKAKLPADGPPLILLHGLNVPRFAMEPLAFRLRRTYGRTVYNLPVPTRFRDIPETSKFVAERMRALDLPEVDVITHSLGGVILRWAANHDDLPSLRRVVMIAPPNTGAWSADFLHMKLGGPLFRLLFGESGLQARRADRGLAQRAGLLRGTEVGIVAGGNGSPKGLRNWFGFEGDTDGTIAVQETILPGMKDFILLQHDHTRILWAADTAMVVNTFLEYGIFRPKIRKDAHEPSSDEKVPVAA